MNTATIKNKGSQGGANKAAIVCVEGGGFVQAQYVSGASGDVVEFLVEKNVKPGTKVMSDAAHCSVNHSIREHVNGECHKNIIEGFWSLFKRGSDGIYHQVSFKHAQRYAHEFVLKI